ncbi:sensor histidine kinase [[Clostridium] polysaccharolyticum]|uniref:histidine kinase n=1 Tax=[Clostridium] polysaccharolyticum TaxID=29364 RepID=A0A1I0FW32_9FIRM|nr:sensor histidine kinase [[Clostridium] polysaccharolyticum]SET62494.1 two-component system, sensor histidine kinase YesM [[Clostridium] polysaccharolyticum]
MKQYLRRKIKQFQDIKFRRKLIITYIFVGVIPIIVLGTFCYSKSRHQLIEREKKNIQDYMQQAVGTLNNQMQIYNNLSDYLSYNQSIAQVVGYPYKSYYEMYQQFTQDLDPLLASLKYFHNDVNQVTIYTSNDIVKHDNTIAPMCEIEKSSWYQAVKGSKQILWFADSETKNAYSCRTMPKFEKTDSDGILYIKVDYEALFDSFQSMSSSNYGVFVVDQNDSIVYEYQKFDKENQNLKLSYQQFHHQPLNVYTVMHTEAAYDNWTVYVYKPNKLLLLDVKQMIFGIVLVALVCILISIFAVTFISKIMVSGIEELTAHMAKVEGGHMEIQVTSESKDEVGELIRGFGKMINEINRLIKEVYESKITQKEYEMKALQAQINPHFLYNSLSLINWKALEAEQPDISRITLRLSSFYRTALNKGKNTLKIRDEISNVKAYIDIQLMMHDYEFDVEVDADEDIMEYETLNLILQPLIENAIDHGIDLLEDRRGRISIIGKREEDNIKLIVEDNGVGMTKEKADSILTLGSKGYGVRNVNERIQLYYGKEYSLQVDSQVGEGTKITICIPVIS